jgi:Glycosyl transferase family 2
MTSSTEFLAGPGTHGLVSVVIVTYNRAPFIREAVDSVLRQTYQQFEVIVVDDGSTDDTAQVMASYSDPRIRFVRQPNGGLSSARNRALELVRGEFMALLDSDDAWHHWKLAAQVEIARRHPEVGLVWTDMSAMSATGEVLADRHLRSYYAAYRMVDLPALFTRHGTLGDLTGDAPDRLRSSPYYVGDLAREMFLGNFVHPPTAFVRRSRLQQSGPYQPEVTGNGGEDYHFFYRVAQYGPVALLDAPAMLYRIHPAQVSTSHSLHYAQADVRFVEHWAPRAATMLSPGIVRRRRAGAHGWLGYEELFAGNPRRALPHLARSLRLRPNQPGKLGLLIVSLLPSGAVPIIRRAKHALQRGWLGRLFAAP